MNEQIDDTATNSGWRIEQCAATKNTRTRMGCQEERYNTI